MEPERASRAIDLAGTPPFRLGTVLVEPAALQLGEPNGARVRLQPRAMQVLVALQRSAGDTLSREELNRDCWHGRVVGADAVDRTIAHLRRASTDLGAPFRIETIPRVGFRLLATEDMGIPLAVDEPGSIGTEAEAAVPQPAVREPAVREPAVPAIRRSAMLNRRTAMAALAALTGAAALRWWPARTPASTHPPSVAAEPQRLTALGNEALFQGLPEAARQAASYFERATQLEPGMAEAWGGLALAHQQLIDDASEIIEAALVRSAAARALAIDRDNPAATAALILLPPTFRNWAARERAIRRGLARQPANLALLLGLGELDAQVGRWRAAATMYRHGLAIEPLQPRARLQLARALWGAGDIEGADRGFRDAARLWPEHRIIWLWRVHFLALTERAREAQAMILDEETRPPPGPGELPLAFDVYAACVRALLPDGASARSDAVKTLITARTRGVVSTFEAVFYLAGLGRPEDIFPLLDHYYFGGSRPWLRPPDPLTRRVTAFLFFPPLAAARRNPRFAALIQRIGLADYWRQTTAWPDDRAAIALAGS